MAKLTQQEIADMALLAPLVDGPYVRGRADTIICTLHRPFATEPEERVVRFSAAPYDPVYHGRLIYRIAEHRMSMEATDHAEPADPGAAEATDA